MGSLSEEVRIEILCEYICDLRAKNAKLHELVADMWNSAVTHMDYADRHAFIGEFVDRMRDLEVEA